MPQGFLCTRRRTELSSKNSLYVVLNKENNRPMSFDGNQFCYSSAQKIKKYPLELYTERDAKDFMEMSEDFRREKGFDKTEYIIMPVYNPYLNS